MNKIDLNYKPLARKDLLFRELDDGGVVYEPASEVIHSLNSSAAYVWALCDGTHSVKDITNSIQEDFKEFKKNPISEVQKIIKKFHQLSLLTSS